jgi:hypothetical protein
MKKVWLTFVLFLLTAGFAFAEQIAVSFCALNGETGSVVSGAEVYVRFHGELLSPGYTDSNGCHETDFINISNERFIEIGVTHRDYLPSYTYPEWTCEILFPASPPFVRCETNIRLVPRQIIVPKLERIER